MEINLVRDIRTISSTIGKLSVDGQHFCYILEDADRKLNSVMSLKDIAAIKIPGKTAIPTGRYQIVVTMSNRFKVRLPLLVDVPGYAGVRIHPGNTSEDTEGCLLPGLSHQLNTVVNSRKAFNVLFDKIVGALAAGDKVWITIR